MKQHITPKQAKELTKEQFYSLFSELVIRNDWANYHHKKVNIGKLIEITQQLEIKIYVDNCIPASVYDMKYEKKYCEIELVDALWNLIKKNIKKD